MKMRCLLINPWIYDFAAVNLWSRPLGLLKLAEYLSQFDIDLRFIDCTDILKRRRKYGTGKYQRQIIEKPEILKSIPKNYARYGISLDDFTESVKSLLPFDLVFITSIMSYWYPGIQKVVEIVKSLSPGTPIILGGIYATLYPEHALETSGVDYIFQGHISSFPSLFLKKEISCEKIEDFLKKLDINFNKSGTPKPYYKLNLYQSYPFAPLLTSIGCPYRCSYCASSVLFNGFIQREPIDVFNEIRELYEMGIRDYAFYDDALLVNTDSHVKVLLKEVIRSGIKVRFHCPNGIHARFISDELAYLMKQSGFTTVRISLETVNPERQKETGGKVTTENFKRAVVTLKKHGFTKEHLGVYLMYGLPDQPFDEVREGVEFLKGLDVRIHLTEFSPVPATSCWEELKSKGIINDNIDPLLTNNSVFPLLYSGYSLDAIEKLKLEVKEYNSR
jgi:radical SAM superfamily enzyme YgiQ (UPF0313 family)